MPTFTVYKGSPNGSITKSTTTKPSPTSDQVLIKITASGLCGTDLHYRHTDMVLGHEGVGTIKSVGPSVQTLKVGDRVGWGYQTNSCMACEYCLTGRETYCPSRSFFGETDFDQGSFATHAIWKESYLFKLPEDLTDQEAAPLMCGGATVFSALQFYGIRSTDRVGVIGVGGLGHLAIQFAGKMGCHVTVFSGTESKKQEAERLGAKEFVALKGRKELQLERKIDALLVTSSVQPDWNLLLPNMAPDSIILPITVSEDNLSIPYGPFLQHGLRFQGSVVAPRAVHRKMLEFAALHGIKPILMEFPLNEEGIEQGMKTLDEGHMRYRGVLIPQK